MAVDRHVVSQSSRPSPVQSTAGDAVTFGPVHLDVTDEQRSLAFWSGLIGLQVVRRDEDGAVHLGVEDGELLVLHAGAQRPVQRGYSGLYHLAIHLPSEAEFARVLGRLLTRRAPNAPTDHIMHWATYLDDPDGIGLELSFETLDRFGRYVDGGGRPMVIDSEGQLRGGVEPLDLDEVFSYLGDRDLERPLPAGTRIGHLHLHVAELEPALDFYAGAGFTRNVALWGVGMADMHAGGSFPHRLAVNTWQGVGAPPPPAGTAGLRHATVRMRADAELGETMVRDPAGNGLLLSPAAGQR